MNLLGVALFALLVPSQSQLPDYYDKPHFVVSGVTDYTYRGGHGSDAVLRSSEALTKATASLSGTALDSLPLSEALEREKTLKDKVAANAANAELHRELADVEERLGNAVKAVGEYQRAAELTPNETNLFDWGAELLKHRAGRPAMQVFSNGVHSFSGSVRMRLGLAVALYLEGNYDKAAQQFFTAADLDPHDPLPYRFLSQVQAKEITDSDGYLERVQRFAKLEPENAWANYYYAACLWEHRSAGPVRALAERAIQLDTNMDVAYLLLGTIDAEQNDLAGAISMLTKAAQINPQLIEAHYRLAQAYDATGDRSRAQQERATYKQLSDEAGQKLELERKQIQQFVFTSEK